MVERVVALVSRIQGTYEFEVQPLREYFAARHLFETAPYSPTGNERSGTRPDRFDALARNSYWLNVTRFFGGCFSKGELPALADCLEELWKEEPYRHLEQPKILGAMLLSDWVFSQHPRSQQRCAVALVEGATLRHVARGVHGGRHSGNPFIFSVTPARAALLDCCFRDLATEQKRDYELGLCALARANGSGEEVYDRWRSELIGAADLSHQRLLWLAIDLGVVDRAPTAQLEEFLERAYDKCLPLIVLADRADVYCASAARYEDAVSIVAERPFSMWRSKRSLLGALAHAFDVEMFEFALREHRHIRAQSFRDVAGMYHDFRDGTVETKAGSDGECDFELQKRVRDLLAVFASESSSSHSRVGDQLGTMEQLCRGDSFDVGHSLGGLSHCQGSGEWTSSGCNARRGTAPSGSSVAFVLSFFSRKTVCGRCGVVEELFAGSVEP